MSSNTNSWQSFTRKQKRSRRCASQSAVSVPLVTPTAWQSAASMPIASQSPEFDLDEFPLLPVKERSGNNDLLTKQHSPPSKQKKPKVKKQMPVAKSLVSPQTKTTAPSNLKQTSKAHSPKKPRKVSFRPSESSAANNNSPKDKNSEEVDAVSY